MKAIALMIAVVGSLFITVVVVSYCLCPYTDPVGQGPCTSSSCTGSATEQKLDQKELMLDQWQVKLDQKQAQIDEAQALINEGRELIKLYRPK